MHVGIDILTEQCKKDNVSNIDTKLKLNCWLGRLLTNRHSHNEQIEKPYLCTIEY